VVGRDDHRLAGRDVLAPDAHHAEVDKEERLQDRPHEPVEGPVDPPLAGSPVKGFVIHRTEAYPF
jgi:hypothetical protein